MRALLTSALLLGLRLADAQVPAPAYKALPLDSSTHRVAYSDRIQVPGRRADEVYARAEQWATRPYVGSKTTIQLVEKTADHLLCRGTLPVGTQPATYTFLMDIRPQAGACQYTITHITRTPSPRRNGLASKAKTQPLEAWGTTRLSASQQQELTTLNFQLRELISYFFSSLRGPDIKKTQR